MAYCLPGTGVLADTDDVTTILIGYDASYSTPLPGRQYAAGWGFILVYRLAIDAKTLRGDGGAG